MRPEGVVLFAPALYDDLRLPESVEDLSAKHLVSELSAKKMRRSVPLLTPFTDLALYEQSLWISEFDIGRTEQFAPDQDSSLTILQFSFAGSPFSISLDPSIK